MNKLCLFLVFFLGFLLYFVSRPQAAFANFPCGRPDQDPIGATGRECSQLDANGCKLYYYTKYENTTDEDGDGIADPQNPNDQPWCSEVCADPHDCPNPTTTTPTPTAPAGRVPCGGTISGPDYALGKRCEDRCPARPKGGGPIALEWECPDPATITPAAPNPTSTPTPLPPSPPCAPGALDSSGKCTSVSTGLGNIGTDPGGMIKSLFGILLGLSGGIALLLIIVSGYQLMTSQGNPEKIQGAKETLTSAIVGLLFIIFSIAILEIIGYQILQIPTFVPKII